MARFYDTVFRTPTGLVTVRSGGNTKREALRWARRELNEHKYDLAQCYDVRQVFVPDDDKRPRRTAILDREDGA